MNHRPLFASLLAVALAACHKAPPAQPTSAETAPSKPIAEVKGKTTTAEQRSFPRTLRATGQLAGQTDAIVAADAMGRVIAVSVERGSVVKAGDMLAKLDDRQAKLSLAEAAAAVALARSRLKLALNEQERNKPLAEKKAIAEADYQKLITEVAAHEAELASAIARQDLAQKAVDDAVIRTVAGGVVAERMVEPGEYVRADSPVARVVDLSHLRLVLNVPETEVGALVIGQTVEFTTAAQPGRVFTGTLKFLGAAMREASRDLVIEAEVDNKDGALRPGLFADARIKLGESKAIAISAEAILTQGSRRRVFVIGEDKTLTERLVEVGETRDGFTEVRRGIAEKESVLLRPGADAVDGAAFAPAN